MTTNQIRDRIAKIETKINKKRNTIIKKTGWIESGKKDEYDIKYLRDDIKRLEDEIRESLKTREKYVQQLIGEMERENILYKKVPESMRLLQMQLVENWNDWDIQRRDKLKYEYNNLGYREFSKKYKRSQYEFMSKTNEDIDRENNRDAADAVIDLYNRVNEITGEVLDWSHITCSGGGLNGVVIGKEGRAKVETIIAGGHNIQRLHIRVLVHSIN